jgi:hypothetical protein
MNSNHDNGENGRLDEDLDRIGRAYRQMDAEEPPELLDLAIRNSARRAVEKKPARMKFGWLHGLTTAAVFILALSVIMHQRENQPAVGNGVQFDRPQPASAAGPDKMQSPANVSGQKHSALEEAPETVKDLTAPAPAAPASEPREQTLGEAFRASRQKESAAPVQQTTAADSDENRVVLERAVEKKEADKPALESMADAPEDAGQSAAANPSLISAPPPAGPEARSDTDLQAEKQLKAIIGMKRNGDENWKEALKTFIADHPGYPVPDELKD